MLDPAALLEQLIVIPSVNRMGRGDDDPTLGEARLTAFLETTLQGLGLATQRQPVAPGQDNLIAVLPGDPPPEQGGRVLLLDAHQDTVPVAGMTIEPFRPLRRDGRVYGRGACDVKGPMAAMIAAVARLAAERPTPRPTILVTFTVNEEHGFTGVRALADALVPLSRRPPDVAGVETSQCDTARLQGWSVGEGLGVRVGGTALDLPLPHAAIVAEPTQLNIVTAHKGVVRWRCHARGRAAHSSRPETGENAIYKMARVVTAIERYAAALAQASPGETVSVNLVRGGAAVNTVPDLATIDIDYRLPPHQTPDGAWQKLVAYLAQTPDVPAVEHERPEMSGLPLSSDNNGALADALAAAVRPITGRCEQIAVHYATNAAFLAAIGIPTVVFGPGDIAQAHTVDEWIATAPLDTAAEILYRFCRAFT